MTYEEVQQIYEKHGFPFYTRPYDINLAGFRQRDNYKDDKFNDVLICAYRDFDKNPIILQHHGTTKPGLYYLKNKLGNVNGTAILAEGHYPSCWTLGLHRGKYEAFVQSEKATFKVWRDNNSDGIPNYDGALFDDVQGLNMHTESLVGDTEKIGAYSAGCQVRQYDREHFMVVEIGKMQARHLGYPFFSYSLFKV